METATDLEVETPAQAKTVCDICYVLSDEYSRDWLFHGVSRDGLTRKQYYTRLENLIECGLMRRNKKVYEITSTGIVIRKALELMDRAVKHNTMLRAFDILKIDTNIEQEELIDKLIDNEEIRNILLDEQRVQVGAAP